MVNIGIDGRILLCELENPDLQQQVPRGRAAGFFVIKT